MSKLDNKRVTKQFDNRLKLTDQERLDIKGLHKQNIPIRQIARQYAEQCSRRTIQFVCYPERYNKVREQNKENRKGQVYYDKDKHRIAMQKYRQHKRELLNNNLI